MVAQGVNCSVPSGLTEVTPAGLTSSWWRPCSWGLRQALPASLPGLISKMAMAARPMATNQQKAARTYRMPGAPTKPGPRAG